MGRAEKRASRPRVSRLRLRLLPACVAETAMTTDAIPLRQLELGRKARIVSIRANGELGRRIRDMGLVPGEEIQVTGRAPLKDPVSLRLRGFTLSLRNSEADQITVEPCA